MMGKLIFTDAMLGIVVTDCLGVQWYYSEKNVKYSSGPNARK